MKFPYNKLKTRVYEIVEKSTEADHASYTFDIFIVGLIFLNVIAVIIGTIETVSRKFGSFLYLFELVSVIIFSIEYIIRMWSCTSNPKYKGISGRLKHAITPLAIVDLLAVLPFYLPVLFDLRFLRIVRLIRLFRLFKLARYSETIRTFGRVFKLKKEELVITVCAILMLLILASSLMFYAENEAQPDIFSSIPSAMWWGVLTLTTVGYGDVSPITTAGKFLGAIIAIIGIGLFALPAGILGSGFLEEIQGKKACNNCPHCGKEI